MKLGVSILFIFFVKGKKYILSKEQFFYLFIFRYLSWFFYLVFEYKIILNIDQNVNNVFKKNYKERKLYI